MLPVQIALDTQKRGNPNDQHINDFLSRQDWKSALKFIERILKKTPSLRQQVNHSLISIVSGDVDRTQKGWKVLRELVESAKPITELEILAAIDRTVPNFLPTTAGPKDFITAMWKRAADALPMENQILESWFESCCRRENLVQASMVALRGSKTLDTKHTCHWRAIAFRYLDSKLGDDQSRQISSKMALALLGQSLKTASTNASTVDVRSIAPQNSMYIRLALRIHEDNPEEALALLDNWMSTRSKVGGGNWELVLSKLKILTKLGRHVELWEFSYQLLCAAAGFESEQDKIASYSVGKTADDMAVWKAAVKSCHELADSSLLTKLQDLLSHPALQKRHRALAAIDLSLKFKNDNRGVTNPPTLSTAMGIYLEHFAGTVVAYSDLRSFATKLTESERQELLAKVGVSKSLPSVTENATQLRAWMFAELNELKLIYLFKISNPTAVAKISSMDSFARNCLELYSLSLVLEKELAITERRMGDEAAVLAACTLIHMYKLGVGEAQLQATMVLEKLLQHSKHHYGAILMLIRLYVRQGIFSKAHEHYQRLDLKNIQLYTESWILLDRIASIFPYCKGATNQTIGTLLTKHASYMLDKESSRYRLIEMYLEKDNLIGLCDVYEFLNTAHKSISRASILAELSRFDSRNQVGDYLNEDGPLSTIIELIPEDMQGHDFKDIHSSTAFPNYEHPMAPSLERLIDLGPVISSDWLVCEQVAFRWRRWLSREEFWHGDCHKLSKAVGHLSYETDKLEHAVFNSGKTDSLTRAELLSGWVSMSMYSAHCASINALVAYPDKGSQQEIDEWMKQYLQKYEFLSRQSLKALQRFFDIISLDAKRFSQAPLATFEDSQWKTLHTYYQLTETFMIFPTFMSDMIKDAENFKSMIKNPNVPVDGWECLNVSMLEEHLSDHIWRADAIVNNYCDGAKQIAAHWKDTENVKKLVASVRGYGPSARLLDEDWTWEKCYEIVQGWKDSLNGIVMEDPKHWWHEYWLTHASSLKAKEHK